MNIEYVLYQLILIWGQSKRNMYKSFYMYICIYTTEKTEPDFF